MDTEAAFQAALDADPSNGGLRMVFADFLDEQGDPRGPGYRVLGRFGLVPFMPRHGTVSMGDYATESGDGDPPDLSAMPLRWFDELWEMVRFRQRVSAGPGRWISFDSRHHADDAAALAWSRLSPEVQARILSAVEVPA